jgi:DNA-binding NtrC family response regulator
MTALDKGTRLAEAVRVLAVDDEVDFLELIEDVLSGQPFSLRTALDPEQALNALAREPADVMLVDLQMPKGGGRRLLAEARVRHPDTYGIVVTAFGSERVAVEMLRELGAIDYLTKTEVTEPRLVSVVRRAQRAQHAARVAAHRGFDIVVAEENALCALYPVGYLSAQPGLKRLPLLGEMVDVAREAGHTGC